MTSLPGGGMLRPIVILGDREVQVADSTKEAEFHPVTVARPPFSHRYELFSPKLQRRVTLFSWDSVQVWTLLEGTPAVSSFCERPGVLDHEGRARMADFWVRTASGPEIWLLPTSPVPIVEGTPRLPASSISTVRVLDAPVLEGAAMLISNWQAALPYVVANKNEITPQQRSRILTLCSAPMMLVDIERAELPSDPIITRSTVFDLTRRGQLVAEDFHQQRLSPRSRFLAA